MFQVVCTKKFIDKYKIKNAELKPYSEVVNPMYNWYATVFTSRRKKYILFVNIHTLFSVLVFNVKLEQLTEAFKQRFSETMKTLHIAYDDILVVNNNIEDFVFTKKSDRKLSGTIARMVNEYQFFMSEFNIDNEPELSEIEERMNTSIYSYTNYKHPNEMFYTLLENTLRK